MNKWLILDCNYLCHRAKHSMGKLSYGNKPTGVIYGFLRGLEEFQDRFNTSQFIFCWDSKHNKRYEIFPEYKAKRNKQKQELPEDELEFENEFRQQMKLLRTKYLKQIGFQNVFCQRGYESDDVIASLCLTLPEKDEAVIITSDKDLYQCIRSNISFYNPQKGREVTRRSFKKEYGIDPWIWSYIKSIAGCSTDEIPGAKGIGEATAIKRKLGLLSFDSKAYEKIDDFVKTEQFNLNVQLVHLPFKGTKIFKLKEDQFSIKGWKQVTKELGMKSIRNKFPIRIRKIK